MDPYDQAALTFAAVVQEAAAVGDATLAGNLEEARFRAHLLVTKADVAGFTGVSQAAAQLLGTLGPPGEPPGVGYGAVLVRVADELDAIDLPAGDHHLE